VNILSQDTIEFGLNFFWLQNTYHCRPSHITSCIGIWEDNSYFWHGSTQRPQHPSKPSKLFSASFMPVLILSIPSSMLSSCSTIYSDHLIHWLVEPWDYHTLIGGIVWFPLAEGKDWFRLAIVGDLRFWRLYPKFLILPNFIFIYLLQCKTISSIAGSCLTWRDTTRVYPVCESSGPQTKLN